MRTLNLTFLLILVVSMALLGGGVHLIHGFQMRRNASALLDRAHRAEDANQTVKAERALSQYLSLRPEDGPTWTWYARVVDHQDSDRRQLERTYLIHHQALRHEPADRALKRRCADLAMELGRHGDAHGLLTELLEGAPTDATAAGRAELEDLLGQCERAMGKHEDAQRSFVSAIGHDPHRIDAFDRLARLRRSELRQDDSAAAAVRDMIARNSESGRAYAYRWRYAQELAPPADEKDVARALELAPDDREVLLTAAMASERKRDLAAMRTYLEKGHRLDPKDILFALSLSRLESREKHLDRAEAVLRRTFEARPLAGLAFELADTLILEGKIDGKDGADDLIAKLRRAGLGDTLVRFLDAEVLFQRKRWTEAVAELETARAVLAAVPDRMLRINLMLAECHGRLGSDDQRLEALRRAAEGDQGADAARLELVRMLTQSGQLDQAISTLSPLAIAGTNPEWRLDLVRLLLQKAVRQPANRRNWPELERHLREVEKAMGAADERVLLLRLDVLAAQGRLDEARTLLTQALTKEPRNLRYRLALSRVMQRQQRDDEALRLIDQAEKDFGASPQIDLARLDYWGQRGGDAARNAVGRLAAGRGQVPAADRPAFLDRLGAVAVRLGRPDLARQYWRELAEMQPENLGVRLGLFDLAILAGDRDEPARLVEQLRKIEGETGTNWRFARAALLLDQARRGHSEGLDEARRLAADITAQRPNSWIGPTLNGQIAELAGSPDQAIADYLRALDLGNVQPSFARQLVRLLDQQGRRAEVDRVTQVLRDQGAALAEITIVQALDAIRRRDYDLGVSLAHQIYPDGSPYSSDHLNLGRIYQSAGRSDEAGKEFRRAVELGPGVPENWLTYVQHLAQTKQPDQARFVIEAARKALPSDRATLTLAQCALAIGDTKNAEALIQQAMDAKKTDDLAALRVAVDVNLRLNHLDAARSYLDRMAASSSASAADHTWANRTRAALLLATNRPADREQALTLLDRNLTDDPESVEDQSLKATILALRPARRGEAVAILERLAGTNRSSDSPGSAAGSGLKLAGTNRLDDSQRFLLAQLHLDQGEGAKYEDEMRGLLNRKAKDPRHLTHFINHWIGKNQLDQAERWLAELKQTDLRGRPALELEARLLDARKRRPELLALLEARAREVPDEIGVVADLLNRHGFAKEAEAAYKAFIDRDPKQPERGLALATFLARRDRVPEARAILEKAWTICPQERVALAALPLFDAPSAGESERRQVEAWLTEAVRGRPQAPGLRFRLGLIWMWQRRFDEAADCFRRILADSPDDTNALNTLAWLLALNDHDKAPEALQLINRAIDLAGANVPSLIDTRAVILIRSGQLNQALSELDRARRGNPTNPNFALHRAWALQEMGNTDEARKAIRQAKELGWTIAKCDPLERNLLNSWGRELIQ